MKLFKDLKNDLDSEFSMFIRMRDTNSDNEGHCFTCARKVSVNNADCGHYIPRADLQVRWCEYNAHIQCRYCNRYMDGIKMMRMYERSIRSRYGKIVFEFLKEEQSKLSPNRLELKEMIEYFKTANKLIKKIKSKGACVPSIFFKLPEKEMASV